MAVLDRPLAICKAGVENDSVGMADEEATGIDDELLAVAEMDGPLSAIKELGIDAEINDSPEMGCRTAAAADIADG